MKPELIVDRIENNVVIVECGRDFIEFPIEAFSETPQEGDRLILSIQKGENSSLSAAENRLKRLKERDSGEDIIDL